MRVREAVGAAEARGPGAASHGHAG